MKRQGAMIPDKSVYFDDFARKQTSPTRTNQQQSVNTQMTHHRPTSNGNGGACEWDRLMQERDDLLKTGTYTEDDPLIKEIER